MNDQLIQKRETLYQEVWSEPVAVVAERYGVSEVALRNICKSLQVPFPPKVYWAKIRAGQKVTKSPLPPLDTSKLPRRRIWKDDPRPGPRPDLASRYSLLPEEIREKVVQVCSDLLVKDRLVNPHWLVKQDQEAREEYKREEKERERHYGYQLGLTSTYPGRRMLEIKVLPAEINRAYRLLDAAFKAVEMLGGTIRISPENYHTEAVIQGEIMRIRLTTSREGAFTLIIDEWNAPRKHWRDTKTKLLESEIGSFVMGLFECAQAFRNLREERQHEEERRRQAESLRRERAERQRCEQERYGVLENTALDWHKAQIIRSYIAELERIAADEPDEQKHARNLEYITWAKGKVEWLDPLITRTDPILGKRRDDTQVDV